MTATAAESQRRPLPPDVAALYPYAPRFVDVGEGQTMAVVDEGPRDAPTVVLLHGNPTWGFLYRAFVPPLLADGYRVVVPDHVGLGRSTKPPAAYHSLDRHVANLERALDAVGARDVTLVIHDWGGPIGLGWAVRHPERVKSLVVMNTVAFVPKRARKMSQFHAFFGTWAGKFLADRLNVLVEVAMRFGVARPLPRAVMRAYRWPFPDARSRAAPVALARLVPDSPQHHTVPALRAIEDGLPKLAEKPAIVLWGDDDPVFPKRFAEKWPEALPGVRRIERFQASHFLQEDKPTELVAAMRKFLAETR